jgi:hypothetical protein
LGVRVLDRFVGGFEANFKEKKEVLMSDSIEAMLAAVCRATQNKNLKRACLFNDCKGFAGESVFMKKFVNAGVVERPLLFSLNATQYRQTPASAFLFTPAYAVSGAISQKRIIRHKVNHMLITENAFYILEAGVFAYKNIAIRIPWGSVCNILVEEINDRTEALWVYTKGDDRAVVIVLDSFILHVITQDIMAMKRGFAPYHSRDLQLELQNEELAYRLLESRIKITDRTGIESFCQATQISRRACEIMLAELEKIKKASLLTRNHRRCVERWKKEWQDISTLA